MKAKYITFCKRCNTETEHYACGNCIKCILAYRKAHYQEYRDEQKAQYQEHRAERLAYLKTHYQENRAERLAYYQEHKAERLAYQKVYYQEHKAEKLTYYQEHRAEILAYYKSYQMSDLNNNGIPKKHIRYKSRYILFTERNHTKLKNYEIHHCFGYNDPNKFIYIPKALHVQIHQRLRDKNISAEVEHFEQIKDLINECKEYTYISI